MVSEDITILEERCDRFRNIIRRYCTSIDFELSVGNLTIDDVLYLRSFEPINKLYGNKFLDSEPKCEKPPLGVMPKYIWDKKRLSDLTSAMQRYLDAEKLIPKEWIDEYNELISTLENN